LFNSKFFCIIVVLTTAALGAAVYFQVQALIEYKLLDKLKTEYLSAIFGDGTAAPVKDAETTDKEATETDKENTAKDADTAKKETTDAAKKDDKK